VPTYTIRRSDAPSRFRIDYRAALNDAQLEAATALEGPMLVIAGAGSGKTRTLTYRVARLVESGVAPGSILLLTFTRRAAQEMIRRAEALLSGGGLSGVLGGTFHSFANEVLRRWGAGFGGPGHFTILDRSDAEDTIDLVRARLGLDQKERRFPRKQTLATIYSASLNRDLPVRTIVESEYTHLLDDLPGILACRDEYARYKREQHLLDYDDLLVELKSLLDRAPELRERLHGVLRYVMVDEYQDTNHLQADIVAQLAGDRGNVMVVGDDAQSIYRFRGADVRNILTFPERFPRARVVTLEENYRSTQPILDVGNAIIGRARESFSKRLFTRRGGGALPCLVPAPDERLQSLFVRQRVLELREEGVSLSDMAVLFRSSFHSFDLELELTRAGVPFVKRGGFRFVETAHVKDVLAHLRVVENPRDAVSWHRILLLLEGVGPRVAAALGDAVVDLGTPLDEAAERLAGRAIRGHARLALRQLGGLLADLDPVRARPVELVRKVVEYYRPILERLHRDDAPKRARDLEQFEVLAERYRELPDLLADLALEPPTDAVGDVLAVDLEEGERLTLSTVHSAKGLEWHTVFVISLLDGRFPSAYSVAAEDLEEERRLLYVACTRARDNLILAYPTTVFDRGSGFVFGQPSRFVAELGAELFERISLVEE
jgi:DNA helicase-2/ATP-dependent DNA helicase PcrA